MFESYVKFVNENRVEVLDDLFLMGSPIKVMLVITAYLLFVKKIAPLYMKDREPYNLRNIMLIYNIMQVVTNVILVLKVVPIFFTEGQYYDWSCMKSSKTRPMIILYSGYVYYMMKVSDLMDTIFMVLRKRFRQATFLHVYHHIVMVLSTYYCARFTGVGQIAMIGLLNSAVHVFMYFYYFLCALNPEFKKSIWWKKHITHLQMGQFMMLILHFSRALLNENCTEPKPLMWFCLLQAAIMLVLFSNFYIRNYVFTPKSKKV